MRGHDPRCGRHALDGIINADDYFRIDSGFLAQPADPIYDQGDFNYDGTINADDYFLMAAIMEHK